MSELMSTLELSGIKRPHDPPRITAEKTSGSLGPNRQTANGQRVTRAAIQVAERTSNGETGPLPSPGMCYPYLG